MSNATHTPGPWVIHDADGIIEATDGTAIADPACSGLHGKVPTVNEAAANARLIAEAPAMLEALRDLVRSGTNGWDGQCIHCGRDNAGEDQYRCAYFAPGDEDNCPYENARAILTRIDGPGA